MEHGDLKRRRKNIKVGGNDWFESRALLPDGFASHEEMMNWPLSAIRVLVSPKFPGHETRLVNFHNMLPEGVWHGELFAGKGSGSTIMRYLEAACFMGLGIAGRVTTDISVDSDTACLKLLKGFRTAGLEGALVPGINHIFGLIESFLTDEAKRDLVAMGSPAGSSAAAMATSHADQFKHLQTNSGSVFKRQASCLLHGCECSIEFPPVDGPWWSVIDMGSPCVDFSILGIARRIVKLACNSL